jgi:AhpD family alkylhydroperoxidase
MLESHPILEFGDVVVTSPAAVDAMHDLRAAATSLELSPQLLELVKLRVSQLNGCAFCVHMHSRDARGKGETQDRLDVLGVWRESSLFAPRERAALAWAEALTLLADSDSNELARVHAEVARELASPDLLALSWAIVHINGWNRIAKSFRFTPGTTAQTRVAR